MSTKSSSILLESGTNELEIVEFFLNEKNPDGEIYKGYYGLNVAKVLEIINYPSVSVMPTTSQSRSKIIRGTFNLRNKIIPLIDLHVWLNKENAGKENDKVIVTEFNNVCNAFSISGVTRIHRIGWKEVLPPSSNIEHFSENCVTGIVRIEDRIIFLLDFEKIITDLQSSVSPIIEDKISLGLNILMAEDSSSMRNLIVSQFKNTDSNLIIKNNGQEAWDYLRETKKLPDVIITDIEMPEMDGMALTKKIKTSREFKNIPVVIYSSLVSDSLRHKCKEVGSDAEISKPEIRKLLQIVKELVEKT